VPLEEAKRRLIIMSTVGDEIGRLESEVAANLSGTYFSHDGTFSLVVRLAGGVSLQAARTLTIESGRTDLGASRLELPVRFEASNGVTRTRAKEIVGTSNGLLRTLSPSLQGFGYDEKTGEMSVIVGGAATEAAVYHAQEADLARQIGMPVRIDVAPVTLAPRAVRGGVATYRQDGSPWCTTAFVGQNAPGQVGVLTYYHGCALRYGS